MFLILTVTLSGSLTILPALMLPTARPERKLTKKIFWKAYLTFEVPVLTLWALVFSPLNVKVGLTVVFFLISLWISSWLWFKNESIRMPVADTLLVALFGSFWSLEVVYIIKQLFVLEGINILFLCLVASILHCRAIFVPLKTLLVTLCLLLVIPTIIYPATMCAAFLRYLGVGGDVPVTMTVKTLEGKEPKVCEVSGC